MGKVGGFLEHRRGSSRRSATRASATRDYREFVETLPVAGLREQGARCMECGVPFCHNGCPLGNLIPDWNDLVYRDRWREAIDQLHAHQQLPGVHRPAVPGAVRGGVRARDPRGRRGHDQADRGLDRQPRVGRGLDRRRGRRRVRDRPHRRGRSAPARRAWPRAQQLRRARPRGDGVRARRGRRRARPLRRAGLQDREVGRRAARASSCAPRASSFEYGVDVGVDVDAARAARARTTRSSSPPARACRATCRCPGRELDGVHFAMEYLYDRIARVAGDGGAPAAPITAAGKHVIVIGGGDTGADCVGHSHREGAASVTQIELLGEPPAHAPGRPDAVAALAGEAAHARTRSRRAASATSRSPRPQLTGNGRVEEIHWVQNSGKPPFDAIAGHRGVAPRRPRAARDGLPRARSRALLEALGVEQRRARQRQGGGVRDVGRRRVRRRRRPPRPVADRVGDQRGPPVRARSSTAT